MRSSLRPGIRLRDYDHEAAELTLTGKGGKGGGGPVRSTAQLSDGFRSSWPPTDGVQALLAAALHARDAEGWLASDLCAPSFHAIESQLV